MTAENRPGQGGQSEERSLVVRSKQTAIESVTQSRFLESLGFSPQFSEMLSGLNDVLVKFAGPIQSAKIKFTPGTPFIETNVDYGSHGYDVVLHAKPRAGASFSIESRDIVPSLELTLEQMQNFIKTVFPNEVVVVKKINPSEAPGLYMTEFFDQITPDDMGLFFEAEKNLVVDREGKAQQEPIKVGKNVPTEVRVSLLQDEGGSELPVIRLYPVPAVRKGGTIITYRIEQLYFEGKHDEVERVMGFVLQLFDNPDTLHKF